LENYFVVGNVLSSLGKDFYMEPNDEQSLYTEDEIVQVLQGLLQVYFQQRWYAKVFWRPWKMALDTAILIFSGHRLLQKINQQNALKEFENLLDES